MLEYKNEPCFAELIILRILQDAGWGGAWIETYGGIHFLQSMPIAWNLNSTHISIPDDKEELLKKIWEAGKTTACFDVYAWNEKQFLFYEAKRKSRDKLTNAQLKFIQGALDCGVSPESLVVIEWDI